MNTWFTADTHWGHTKIVELCNRPYTSVEQMDEALIENWNAVVAPGDAVYHLGDFAFHKPAKAAEIASRLNGQKYLVWGNHDGKRYRKEAEFLKHWIWAKDLAEIEVADRKIVLCHFPMLTWNKSHHGSWHLHGHCHGSLLRDPGAFRVDVGVDCWKQHPVSLEDVAAEMATRAFVPIDHHKKREY